MAKEEQVDPYEAFIKEYKELCQKHNLCISPDWDRMVYYIEELEGQFEEVEILDNRRSTWLTRREAAEKLDEERRQRMQEQFKQAAAKAGISEELLP